MFNSPLIAAPMAGGSTTTSLALAAQDAGAFAFAAGGYRTAEQLAAQIAPLRDTGIDFGVNLFVPRSQALTPEQAVALRSYAAMLAPTAERYGAQMPDVSPAWADPQGQDYWDEKVALLLAEPVPVVSFTFGLAPARVVSALQKVGSRVVASVTSVAEAIAAAHSGVDALIVQHANAGGHSAAFLESGAVFQGSLVDLIVEVRAAVKLPLVGAGGISSAGQAKDVLRAGAVAAAVGTALLRTDESGASVVHKDALADPRFASTEVTRAFTGKPARALVNDFVRSYTATAPDAYPEVHFLTAPLRAGAAAAHDAQALNLWAGTGWKLAKDGPAAAVVRTFLQGM
ncbi:MAG: nitronate monooxygenase [Specibacter sp.]